MFYIVSFSVMHIQQFNSALSYDDYITLFIKISTCAGSESSVCYSMCLAAVFLNNVMVFAEFDGISPKSKDFQLQQ